MPPKLQSRSSTSQGRYHFTNISVAFGKSNTPYSEAKLMSLLGSVHISAQ
jgi:hypothetical protein